MRIVLMGPPGAGKGTQAGLWCRRHGLTHVTTGSLIRGEIEADTRAGRQAHAAVAAGRLVPDAIVEAMVARRLARLGHRAFLLDGFPRTVEQAAWLTAELARHGAALDAVVCLQVCDAVVVERLSQRRMHPETGEVYHLTLRPPPPSVDPACLLQREDDRPAVIRERLRVYREETVPVCAFFRREGLLVEVEAEDAPEAVYARVEHLLNAAPVA